MLMTARESPLGNVSRIGLPAYDWCVTLASFVRVRMFACMYASSPCVLLILEALTECSLTPLASP
jgi:hypothetical protein